MKPVNEAPPTITAQRRAAVRLATALGVIAVAIYVWAIVARM